MLQHVGNSKSNVASAVMQFNDVLEATTSNRETGDVPLNKRQPWTADEKLVATRCS
jgi:hypothetical protein